MRRRLISLKRRSVEAMMASEVVCSPGRNGVGACCVLLSITKHSKPLRRAMLFHYLICDLFLWLRFRAKTLTSFPSRSARHHRRSDRHIFEGKHSIRNVILSTFLMTNAFLKINLSVFVCKVALRDQNPMPVIEPMWIIALMPSGLIIRLSLVKVMPFSVSCLTRGQNLFARFLYQNQQRIFYSLSLQPSRTRPAFFLVRIFNEI